MEKIYISGTGRCGTTFLIKLFTFLDFNTGWNRNNCNSGISKNCNSGMERQYNSPQYIIKNPTFIDKINDIVNDMNIKIKYFIIPIRDYKLSAQSRVNNGKNNGGLWNANDIETQLIFYNKIVSNFVYFMTKYEINTIFLDFDKMVNDKEYLFNKLKPILDEKNITIEYFSTIYDEVTLTSKK